MCLKNCKKILSSSIKLSRTDKLRLRTHAVSKLILLRLELNFYCFGLSIVIQCWFKLSGQNEQNLNFQTSFSQIGLKLDQKWREQKLLRISAELI